MSLALPSTQCTPDDLLRIDGGRRFELVHGELVEINMGAVSSWIGGQVFSLLENHNNQNRTGWVFPADTGYRCFPGDPNMVRKPDVSFVRLGRLPGEQLPDGWITIAPDLVVEVVSPNDLADDVQKKVQEYLEARVSLVWVVYPESRTLIVHRVDGSVGKLQEADELSGEDVVPGFSCQLADVFPPTE